ncbi:MAG TPA: dihydrofolate reductase family protein [Candidatus Paceibacterota bacterium]|nr:dihydrofolate reductase family protein [Verrucomicrobiota bacterium]HSA11516.1 dihydrofolate reductase family protein [Candidatus Paceibacterota bacterium]
MKRPAKTPRRSDLLPFVLVNMAMTADGKIATANRAVSSFSSRRDQQHLLELRATADAVMAGARTVDLNAVHLGPGPAKYRRLRLRRSLAEYNLRIIVSRTGSVNPAARVFQRVFSPIIILTTRRATASRIRRLGALAAEVKICGQTEINFHAALRWLRKKWKVKRLLCEGGGELNDALFRGGLANELHLTVCPRIFGGRTAPTIADGSGAKRLAGAARLELQSARRRGDEVYFVYRVLPRITSD